ncbi:E3 ubiquitin-protein ligase ATL23-like [Zingiber officinale]|uniref:RING-type domain-containing protein n=1 Tax=Zingiber officinale TaxID=94328 RepID=A0A8J5LK93_ZINOF|nr:E3 ubiquitin-protein ligase ATL23-like [Zingiber officinale]KAG6515703.1 hypothetical protein ZIOFF_026132 [Zingiber officinale]
MWAVFFAFATLFLVCFGIGMMFTVYVCLMWSAMLGDQPEAAAMAAEGKAGAGLSTAELDQLAAVVVGAGVGPRGQECAVCLEEIEEGQAARVLPGCRHAFHRECADRWLAEHRECPLCRTVLCPPPPTPPPAAAQVQVVVA